MDVKSEPLQLLCNNNRERNDRSERDRVENSIDSPGSREKVINKKETKLGPRALYYT